MKILFLFFFVIDFVTVVELCIDFYLFYYINIYKNTNTKIHLYLYIQLFIFTYIKI